MRFFPLVLLLSIAAGPSGCIGPAQKCIARDLALTLPFHGEDRLVIQGNGGRFSHTGRYRYAWDFAMPEDTQVVAAADGIVAEVVDSFSEGRPDHALDQRANLVVIDHGGARFSVYQHLRQGGSLVSAGQPVSRGDPVGLSGNTGYSTAPHLHFAVIDARNRSQPVCFADVPGGVPRAGQRVHGEPRLKPPSTLPADVFADNGILLEGPVPARHLSASFTVRGRVTRKGEVVTIWFARRDRGGDPVTFTGPVAADGRFRIDIDLRRLADMGRALDLAIIVHGTFAPYHFDFSVPVFVEPALRQSPQAATLLPCQARPPAII